VLATLYLAAAAGAATARIHVNNAASALAGFYLLPALGFAGLRERNGLHEVDDLLVALTLDEGGARDFAAGHTHHRCGCRRQWGRLWGSFHLLGTHSTGRKDLDIAWPDALKGPLSFLCSGNLDFAR
jgi:hypothetical protein